MAPSRVVHARSATIAASGVSAAHLASDELVVQLGSGVYLGEYTLARESVLACDDVGEQYFVHLPVTGKLRSRYRGTDKIVDRQAAAVFSPAGGPFVGRWTAGARSLCVTLDAGAVDEAFTALTGIRPDQPLRPGLTLPVDSGPARSWIALARFLGRRGADPEGLLTQAPVAEPLTESLVNGFLLSVRHQYSEALTATAAPARPRAVTAAIDLMENDPARPWTLATLARGCGVSGRTLQSGFRTHVGVPPMVHLRKVRLRRAHADLRAADPYTSSVTAVARRWGFAHLGRFSAAHLAAYGQSPQATLRSS